MDVSPPSRMERQLTEGQLIGGEKGYGMIGAHHCDDIHEDVQERPVSVCMIGTGEYTTGYVHGQAADSDKGAGGEIHAGTLVSTSSESPDKP